MAQWSTRIIQVIFAVLDVSWTMGLKRDKTSTSKFFCINICCFSTRFYIFFVPQWHSHPSFMKIVDVFLICTHDKTRMFIVRLAVTTKYQGNCLAAEVLLKRDHPRVVPIGPIVRGVSISNIGNMMGCDHPSYVPVGQFAGELWHFEYFPTTTLRHFEFQKF